MFILINGQSTEYVACGIHTRFRSRSRMREHGKRDSRVQASASCLKGNLPGSFLRIHTSPEHVAGPSNIRQIQAFCCLFA